jgi:HlyD family secretion protein
MESVTGSSRAGRRRRWWRLAVVLVVVVAVVVGLRLTVLAPEPLIVRVEPVTRGAVEETVTNTRAGTVKARLRSRLSPQVGGRVVAVPHREGARVEAGALLVQLDDEIARSQLELARQDVKTTEARAEEACLAADLATSELLRITALHERGYASEQALETLDSEQRRAAAACRAARAAAEQARARVRVAASELELTEIRAPFAGIVAEVSTEVGEWITPSPPAMAIPAVVDLLDPSTVYVSAPIDEMDAERVRPGQRVRLTVDSRRGETYDGELVRVASYVLDIVEQNRTVEVEARFDDPEVAASLLPGTSADVEVVIERHDDVVQVPTAAVAQGSTVLVLSGDRLEERQLDVGLASWRTTEVLAGLEVGERVVVARDSPKIVHGALARAEGEAAP